MKRSLLILILLLAATSLSAQWKVKPKFGRPRVNNVTFELQGGAGALLIDKSMGEPTKLGFTASGNIGYTYLYGKEYGIHTGIGFSYMNSGFSSPSVESDYQDDVQTYMTGKDWTGPADFEARTADVDETYTTLMVTIPIQWVYTHNLFWANIGAKLTLPISVNADYTYGPSSRRIAYISETQTSLPYPDHILGSAYDEEATTGSYTVYSLSDGIRVFVSLSVEAGFRIPQGKDNSIYIGAYLDYAINKLTPVSDEEFLQYNVDHSVLAEDYDSHFNGALRSTATGGFNNFSAGVKVYYNLSFGRRIR